MVLYIEALRVNIEKYVFLAAGVKSLLDAVGVEGVGFSRAMAVSRENLRQLEGLLAAGITELEVPEKTG